MSKRIANTVCTAFLLGSVLMVGRSHATTQAGDTLIVKEDGKWHFPKGACTYDLHIVNRDTGLTHILPVKTLFPAPEYKIYVAECTDGFRWGHCAISFIVKIEERDYFCMSFWTGKRLLIKLRTGTVEDPSQFAKKLEEEEKRQIELILAEDAKLISAGKAGWSSARLHGAMLLAAKHGMTQVRADLEIIEQHSWDGPFSGGPIPYYWNYAKGLNDNIRKEGWNLREGRRFAQLALRRLGLDPKGYSQYVFEKAKENVMVPPEGRKRKSSLVNVGWTSRAVYRSLGSPDYLMNAVEDDETKSYARRDKKWMGAWRYDFDPPDDFSLILIWDDEGMVHRIERITPALWHGDDLFSDTMPKPTFQPDGDLNGIHLYSPHFLGTRTSK